MAAGAPHRRVAAFVAACACLVLVACAPPPGPGYPAMPAGRFSTPIVPTDQLEVWWDQQYSAAEDVDGVVVPLLMDVAAPRGLTGPTPLVIVVHGGGFAF